MHQFQTLAKVTLQRAQQHQLIPECPPLTPAPPQLILHTLQVGKEHEKLWKTASRNPLH